MNTTSDGSVSTPAILVLSRIRSSEMNPALAAIERYFPAGAVRFCADPASAERLVGRDRWFPDLAVVCQHWPGEYTSADVGRLLSLLPLARWISIRGIWCESDGRNGTPWPAAVCVPARSAAQRIRLERRVLEGHAAALPLTASRDEIFAFESQSLHSQSPHRVTGRTPTVRTVTNDPELRRVLNDLLAAEGFNPETSPRADSTPDAIVWDVDPISPGRCDELRRLQAAHPHAVITALSTMAHPEDVDVLSAGGVADVVAKLHFAEILPASLQAALASNAPQSQ